VSVGRSASNSISIIIFIQNAYSEDFWKPVFFISSVLDVMIGLRVHLNTLTLYAFCIVSNTAISLCQSACQNVSQL
jgi:hypothetical protein